MAREISVPPEAARALVPGAGSHVHAALGDRLEIYPLPGSP